MIDAPVTTMDYLDVATTGNKYRAQRASKSRYRNMEESPNAKCDLIFDSYIDPTTVRHMTIPIVKRHDATQEAMRLLVCDAGIGTGIGSTTTTNMEAGTSSTEKKRFRLTPPGTSRTGSGDGLSSSSRMDIERHNRHPQQTLPFDPTTTSTLDDDQEAAVDDDDNDASTYTSKRMKHNNDLLHEVSSKEEEWNFVPYPNHKDIDHALHHQFQGISQLLVSWDQVLCSDPYDYDILQQTNDLGTGCIVDVEHALLDFHVASDDWNGNRRVLSSTTTADTKQHRERRQDLSKYHKVLPSDSSSVSSISFLEQHQQVPIPTLLRVTTSRILEEQELIWEQIKQEHHEPDPVQRCDINSIWHHEVTRGYHIHPPMSPQGRRHTGNLYQESLAANETDIEESVANGSVGFKTPTSGKRQNFPSKMQSLPSLGPLFPMNSPVRPAQVTPSKTDHPSRSKSLLVRAPCLGCQTHVPSPQPVSSVVASSSAVYCIYCGMLMASADLMRSFMEVDDDGDENFVSTDTE